MEHFNIAIDGPAGAGKSTIAKLAAKRLGFVYVDTGAMYRTIALHILREGIDPQDEAAVSAACRNVNVTIAYKDGVQQVLLNGENVSGLIRAEEVGKTGFRHLWLSSCERKAGGASKGACKAGKCCYGRKGYRNLCASRCSG